MWCFVRVGGGHFCLDEQQTYRGYKSSSCLTRCPGAYLIRVEIKYVVARRGVVDWGMNGFVMPLHRQVAAWRLFSTAGIEEVHGYLSINVTQE